MATPDLSRMKNLIGKSWTSWNLPEEAKDHDLRKMRAIFKPKETKIPLEHTNPLPNRLMYLYGARPDFDWFSLTQCPACKRSYKTQWLNNHFCKNTASEYLCRATDIVVSSNPAKKKKVPKRSHEPRTHSRYHNTHGYHRHRSKKSHDGNSKTRQASLVIVSEKMHRDRYDSPSKSRSTNKEKSNDDVKRHSKEKVLTSSNRKHSSSKDGRISSSTSYTLSIPDDKDAVSPVKVVVSNKKSKKHRDKSPHVVADKVSKDSKSHAEHERTRSHKDNYDSKSKSGNSQTNSSHKHKKTSKSHLENAERDIVANRAHDIKEEYKFKIPLKSKSSSSNSQMQENCKPLTGDSSRKSKTHSSNDTGKSYEKPALPKIAYRSQSATSIPITGLSKHSENKPPLPTLKMSQNMPLIVKSLSAASEPDLTISSKGNTKSLSKDKSNSTSSLKHSGIKSTSSGKSSSPSSSSKIISHMNSKSPVSVSNSKSSVPIKLSSSDIKFSSSKSSSLLKQPSPVPLPKSSPSKNSTSQSRSSSSKASSSSSKYSSSKSTTISSSKSITKSPPSVSPKMSPTVRSKSPSSSSLKSTPIVSSKSSIGSSIKLPLSLPLPKISSSKSQSIPSKDKSSKSQVPSVKSSSSSSVSSSKHSSSHASSNFDTTSGYEIEANYAIKLESSKSSSGSKYVDAAVKHVSASSKEKKSSKLSSSVTTEPPITKQSTGTKEKRHSSKHSASSTQESKPSSIEKQSPITPPKERKSSSKVSASATPSPDMKASKSSSIVSSKKTTAIPASINSPTNYKIGSPVYTSSVSTPVTSPHMTLSPAWTSNFKSSLTQSQTAAPKTALPSVQTPTNNFVKSNVSSFHKSPMTVANIQPGLVVSTSIASPPVLKDQVLNSKISPLNSIASFIQPGSVAIDPVDIKIEKPNGKHSHHKKKKKKKEKDEPRKVIPLKDRCFHPDQHCGVVVAPSTMPCKRSLTCKTHSIALRRNVAGRSSSFDSLLAAHKKARDEEKQIKKEAPSTPIPEEPVIVQAPQPAPPPQLPPPPPPPTPIQVELPRPPVTIAVNIPKPVAIPVVPKNIEVPQIAKKVEVVQIPQVVVTSEEDVVIVEAEPSPIVAEENETEIVKEIFDIVVVDENTIPSEGSSIFEVRDSKKSSFNTTTMNRLKKSHKHYKKIINASKRQFVEESDGKECVFMYWKKRILDSQNISSNVIVPKEKRKSAVAVPPGIEAPITKTIVQKKGPVKKPKVSDPKLVYKVVDSLRNRQAARRIAAIHHSLYADNCMDYKMHLIAKHAQMAKRALLTNDLEKCKKHMAVKKIMTKDSVSITLHRLAKGLARSKLSTFKQQRFSSNNHALIEKCLLDRKHFLSKKYILIKKQLQNRERAKARKRFLALYRLGIKKRLMTTKHKLKAQRKLAAKKASDKHFKLNVYRNLTRIRKNIFHKLLQKLHLRVLRKSKSSVKQNLEQKMSYRKRMRLLNSKNKVQLAKNRIASREIVANKSNCKKAATESRTAAKGVKNANIKKQGSEKRIICGVGQKGSLNLPFIDKPCVITVLLPASKKILSIFRQQSLGNSVKPGLNADALRVKQVFQQLKQGSKGFFDRPDNKENKMNTSMVLAKNPLLGSSQNEFVFPDNLRKFLGDNFKAFQSILLNRSNLSRPLDFEKRFLMAGRGFCQTEQPTPAKSAFQILLEMNGTIQKNTSLPKVSLHKNAENRKPAIKTPSKTNTSVANSIRLKDGNSKNVSNPKQSFAKSENKGIIRSSLKSDKNSKDTGNVQTRSTFTNSKGQHIDANVSQQTTSIGKTTKSDIENRPGKNTIKQTFLRTYRIVDQNFSNEVGKSNNKESQGKGYDFTQGLRSSSSKSSVSPTKIKTGSKVPEISIVQNTEQESKDKTKVTKRKSESTKNIQGLLSESNNTQTKSLKSAVENSQQKGMEPQVKNSESGTNLQSRKPEKASEPSKKYKTLPTLVASDAEKQISALKESENLTKVRQSKYVTILLAVQKLIDQKRKSGQKSFSEAESKLIKEYLRYQSGQNKNRLIAKCLISQNSGVQTELSQKIMLGTSSGNKRSDSRVAREFSQVSSSAKPTKKK